MSSYDPWLIYPGNKRLAPIPPFPSSEAYLSITHREHHSSRLNLLLASIHNSALGSVRRGSVAKNVASLSFTSSLSLPRCAQLCYSHCLPLHTPAPMSPTRPCFCFTCLPFVSSHPSLRLLLSSFPLSSLTSFPGLVGHTRNSSLLYSGNQSFAGWTTRMTRHHQATKSQTRTSERPQPPSDAAFEVRDLNNAPRVLL
ncbi:hypothetical protein BC827DRAFT_616901 [Russula dissimulans]|nr:hypothetical protein BC827DRAFT_616901 [Russula dissimulans]